METHLYGFDAEERIVGVHPVGREPIMRVYTRHPDGKVTSRDEPYKPFVVLSDTGLDRIIDDYARLPRAVLNGDGHFRHLVGLPSWRDVMDVKRELKTDNHTKHVYAVPSESGQYLMQSGKTMFKGMVPSDIRRLNLDIEVVSKHGFPQASNPEHKIIIVSLWDNHGYKKVLSLKASKLDYVEHLHSEAELLRATVREIHRRDPDAIVMHNGLGFDFPYIFERGEMLDVPFAIGRDNSVPRSWEAKKKVAERDITYRRYDVAGRALIDTMFLVAAYDAVKREMPDHTLKGAAKYFGFAREGRVYVPGDKIAETWERDPETLLEYALDDVDETNGIYETLGGSSFFLTQMVPMDYAAVHLSGTASIVESLLVREYLHLRHALPHAEKGKQEWGGYTNAFLAGRFEDLVYADVNSLYPSVMIQYRAEPESDKLGVFHEMLIKLTALRFATKAEGKAAKKAGNEELARAKEAEEQAYKIVINSFYGYMGFAYAIFNDFSEADRVARQGQEILHLMMDTIRGFGGKVIACDTDGVLYEAPCAVKGDQPGMEATVEVINAAMPEGIGVGMDGLFKTMLSYRKKNYALQDYDGKVKIKGGALKSRRMEGFLREYLSTQIGHLIDGNVPALWETHERTKTAIYRGEVPVEMLSTRAALKAPIKEYERKIESGNNRQAQYELAIKRGEQTGRRPETGDVVAYYIAGTASASTIRAFEHGKLADEFTPGDANAKFYLKRLHTVAERFERFFPEDFARMFVKPPRNNPKREYLMPTFDELERPEWLDTVTIAEVDLSTLEDDAEDEDAETDD